MINKHLQERRSRIKSSIRKKISGTQQHPRLTVYRSLSNIYGQIIDDITGTTLVSVSGLSKEMKEAIAAAQTKVQKSAIVGEALAKKALAKNIKEVVFDRNGYLYHGRVKALADGARKGGLKF